MELSQFNQKLEQSFKKYFPHGYFYISKSALFDENNPTYFYRIGLIGETKDCSMHIRENDPMNSIFELNGLTIDTITGVGLYCTPDKSNPKEKYNAMSFRKAGFRKATKKNLEEVLNYMDKFFMKLRQFVDENGKDIYHVETYPEYYIRQEFPLEKVMRE
jgi:hypothetical protein